MRKLIRLGVVAAVAAVVAVATQSPAAAATGSWSVTRGHYNIYSSGGFATQYFSKVPSSQVPSNATITGTSVQVTPYTNGRTTETITLCYQKQYTSTDFVCAPPVSITGATTLTTSLFNGQGARGAIGVRHHLYGGTYPAVSFTQDTVTVSYQY